MDCHSPLARNYAVCHELKRRASASLGPTEVPDVDTYVAAAQSMGMTINTLAEDNAQAHDIYGVFYGPPFTQGLQSGVLLAILIDNRWGSARTVSIYPTDDYSSAVTGPLVEPLPLPVAVAELDADAPLARNYGVCRELQRRASASLDPADLPDVDGYESAAESLGMAVYAIAEDGGRGHGIYGVFEKGGEASARAPGVMVAIIDKDYSGAAYVVPIYPTDNRPAALT